MHFKHALHWAMPLPVHRQGVFSIRANDANSDDGFFILQNCLNPVPQFIG
jgi:hypothetical protein